MSRLTIDDVRRHLTRDGEWIRIEDMDNEYLLETITFLQKQCKEGVFAVVAFGSLFQVDGGVPTLLVGQDAAAELHLDWYLEEANRRGFFDP